MDKAKGRAEAFPSMVSTRKSKEENPIYGEKRAVLDGREILLPLGKEWLD